MTKATCVVYWLYDETCVDPSLDGYIGITTRLSRRIYSHKQSKCFPDFKCKILFEGTISKCRALEYQFRSKPNIGWNVGIGGNKGRYPGYHMSEAAKEKVRAKIIERGGIINPIPKGTRRSEAERTRISAGTIAAGPLTAEQQARRTANTPRGKAHHAFGKPMKLTNPSLGKDQNGAKNPFFGRNHSKETRQKIREARTGSNHSDETRQKLREISLAMWAARRTGPAPLC